MQWLKQLFSRITYPAVRVARLNPMRVLRGQ
jgi:hypothetical protein